MTKQELNKLTKTELFELEKSLKRPDPMDKRSKEELKKEMDLVKHVLYECAYCTDSVTNLVEGKDGEEYEYFVADCGKRRCPYRNHFIKMSEQEEEKQKEIDEELSKFA
jgi:NADH:ubiquinone oxidoreductase subunit D